MFCRLISECAANSACNPAKQIPCRNHASPQRTCLREHHTTPGAGVSNCGCRAWRGGGRGAAPPDGDGVPAPFTVIPAKAGTYPSVQPSPRNPPPPTPYDKRPLRRRPPHPLRWTPTGQSRARGNPDGRGRGDERWLHLAPFPPQNPHFRPRTAPNRPHRQPDPTSKWCQMVPNGATIMEQGVPEPSATQIEEPYPAESPPASDAHDAGAPELRTPIPLTPKQMLAFPYIVSASSLRQAAEAAQIGRNTLTRWMQDPRFRAEVERAREEVADPRLRRNRRPRPQRRHHPRRPPRRPQPQRPQLRRPHRSPQRLQSQRPSRNPPQRRPTRKRPRPTQKPKVGGPLCPLNPPHAVPLHTGRTWGE